MKKTLRIIIIILAVVVLVPVVSICFWYFQPQKQMNIILVDKTVPSLKRQKHKSFNWVLTSDRFVKGDTRKSYSYSKDYYGFFPSRPEKSKLWDKNEYRLVELSELAEKSDALYFADTYGVFFNDWYLGSGKSRRSRRLYGGLNNNDNLLIKEMRDRNKLVVLEYNCFDYPTAEYESYRVQEKMKIKSTRWSGRYFASLDSTSAGFPIWVTDVYRKQYKKPWTFSKKGIVLLKDNSIIVLEEGTHLKEALPVISSDSSFVNRWGLPEYVTFDNLFDIIEPFDNQVISNFELKTTKEGEDLLNDNGLDNHFPAVVRDPQSERFYYFAGDFTFYNVNPFTAVLKGHEKFQPLYYSKQANDPRRFFWLYYKPLIKGIFNDYYNTMAE